MLVSYRLVAAVIVVQMSISAPTRTSTQAFEDVASCGPILPVLNPSQPAGGTLLNSSLAASPRAVTAASASLADVRAAISAAKEGDTVLVPAGSATWDSALDIRKGILLIGAGIGKTNITRGGPYIISYDPAHYESNSPFRLSGFSFDGNGGNIMFLGENVKPAPYIVQTRIRIDHNRFLTTTPDLSYQALTYRGALYGVVDSNVFDTFAYPMRNTNTGWGSDYWDHWATAGFRYILGDSNNIFFEDNTFNLGSAKYNCVTDSQYSGRYLLRYNTISMQGEGQTLLDIHGNQPDADMYASFGAEVYGNLTDTHGFSCVFQAHRGGQLILLCNAFVGGTSGDVATKIWDDYDESLSPTTSPDSQDPNNGYYYLNILGYAGPPIRVIEDEHAGDCPLVNRDYFTDDTANGRAGMSGGKLADRPASGTSVGQGYWATDQDLKNILAYVGANHSAVLQGTLYKWTGFQWTAFWTPYPYPHPLRSLLGDGGRPSPR